MKDIIAYILLYVANAASVCTSWGGLYQPNAPKKLENQIER